MIIRGLVLDVERGNVLKANRFGFVRRAAHGHAPPLDFEEMRTAYAARDRRSRRAALDLSQHLVLALGGLLLTPNWWSCSTPERLPGAARLTASLYQQVKDSLDPRARSKGS